MRPDRGGAACPAVVRAGSGPSPLLEDSAEALCGCRPARSGSHLGHLGFPGLTVSSLLAGPGLWEMVAHTAGAKPSLASA